MSSENLGTQSRNLPFSIENILREDFPPKSRLAFPPRHYHLPETPKEKSSATPMIKWVPIPRYTAFLPLYYGRYMHLPPYRAAPMESKDLDSEKQENMETCVDCNTSRSEKESTSVVSLGQGEIHEEVETKSCDSADDNPSEEKEPQSRKRRSRSQFTPMQLKYLEKYYSDHSYLSRDERTVLAQALNMKELQIRNWFQNKRYHKKNKMQK